jgi:hypothetical protein
MDVEKLTRGTVLVFEGATVAAGSSVSPSPIIVEEVGSTRVRVRTHTGESLELPHDRLEALYELASPKVSDRAIERYWQDF